MPVLTLICGLPCSGKTTLAASLAQQTGALWLSADEWMVRLAPDRAAQDRLREPVEAIILDHSMQLLARGQDVILDFGFWFREERAAVSALAKAAGAEVSFVFCDAPLEELVRRLHIRNAQPGSHLYISEEELRRWSQFWEPPTDEEAL
jgi:predicted kinase